MNRGSSCVLGRWARPTRCFNEAPIHESGKWDPEERIMKDTLMLQ